MYSSSNEQLTGFRIGKRTTGGSLVIYPEKALPSQEGFFSKALDFQKKTQPNNALNWFNEIVQILSGVNTIIQENANHEQQKITEEKSTADIWKLFIGLSIIAIVVAVTILMFKK